MIRITVQQRDIAKFPAEMQGKFVLGVKSPTARNPARYPHHLSFENMDEFKAGITAAGLINRGFMLYKGDMRIGSFETLGAKKVGK